MRYFYLYGIFEDDICLYIGRSLQKPGDYLHSLKNKQHSHRDITNYILSKLEKKYIVKTIVKKKKCIKIEEVIDYQKQYNPKFKNYHAELKSRRV